MISATLTFAGFFTKKYPSPFPFLLSSTPINFNSSKIFSRNLRGIFFFLAISEISTGPSWYFSVRYDNAFNAYCERLDSTTIKFQECNELVNFFVTWQIHHNISPMKDRLLFALCLHSLY